MISTIPSGNGPVSLVRPITTDERAKLEQRSAAIEARLAERNRDAVQDAVNAMMLATPTARPTADDAALRATAYVAALASLPPWAVAQAIAHFVRGEVADHNPRYVPTSGQIYAEASNLTLGLRKELTHYRRILTGETEAPPEERQRITEGFSKLKTDLIASMRSPPRNRGLTR